MKSHLILSSTKDMDYDTWLQFRKRGIGASEVGAIMGLSEYTSSIQLFYEKISPRIEYKTESIAMFQGKELESHVANLWQYWGGTEASMIANFRARRKVQRMQRVNAYVQNPKYPWLFVSLDRKINKSSRGSEGALEVKTIAGYEADKWDGGIPPSHIVQVQTQCQVCEFSYGDLAAMKDGRYLDVYEFDYMRELCENIVETTHAFWLKVEKARSVLTQRYEAEKSFNMRQVEELTQELHSLEPEPDGSQAYTDFLKDQYKEASQAGERQGTLAELEAARAANVAKQEIKEIEERVRLNENYLRSQMRDKTVLSFGKDGRVTWKPNVNNVRTFINNVKV